MKFIIYKIKTLKERQFFLFVLAGGTAAFINFTSRFLYNVFFSFGISIIAAYITGMVTAFILNRLFVFKKSTNSLMKQVLYFIFINLIAIILTYYITLLFYEKIFPYINMSFHPKSTSHLIGITVPVISSFIGHKFLTFKINKK